MRAVYLLGPVLAFVLRLRGVVTTHASSVSVDGKAVAFIGPQGAGKSTTAAALLARGCNVLTDDVVPICDKRQPAAGSARHFHKCISGRVDKADGRQDYLPPLCPSWDKRFLDLLAADGFQAAPVPLAALYLLAPRSSDGGGAFVEDVSPNDALLSLERTCTEHGAIRNGTRRGSGGPEGRKSLRKLNRDLSAQTRRARSPPFPSGKGVGRLGR